MDDAFRTDLAMTSGIRFLWTETLGDPRICIAILDGPVDQTHPSLVRARLTRVDSLASGAVSGSVSRHGTHIASVIFGQHEGPVSGIAPRCRGLIVPIFSDAPVGGITPCSQVDLARAILQAAQHGAHVINISGGQALPSGSPHPILSDAVAFCERHRILIVASVGNDSCECLHIPAAIPCVLAVGAADLRGVPMDFSNWSERYAAHGILAPGENILGATPGGDVAFETGTSYATPVVSGVAALLLSLQWKLGQLSDPLLVRDAILRSAVGCKHDTVTDCRRLLAGRLNVRGAMSIIMRSGGPRTESQRARGKNIGPVVAPPAARFPFSTSEIWPAGLDLGQTSAETDPTSPAQDGATPAAGAVAGTPTDAAVSPSACACGCPGKAPAQFAYALGELYFDFGTEARRDSILQQMGPGGNPYDPRQLLAYLENNPWDAASVIWTLRLDQTPIYAVQPRGSFGSDGYQRLRRFLGEQVTDGVERISVPGVIGGRTTLFTGETVPVIWPEIRGMYSWTTNALLKAVTSVSPPADNVGEKEKKDYVEKTQPTRNFLERVYFELRNLGTTPEHRALNFAATNAFSIHKIFEAALKDQMELDQFGVERSPICRPESDCWDVKLVFFDPRKVFEQARKVYRATIDVSDVVPVTVGPVRSWSIR